MKIKNGEFTGPVTAKIQFGDVEVPDEVFEPKNVKVRITTHLDGDVLDTLKQLSKQKEVGYQTLLNGILRAYLFAETGDSNNKADVLSLLDKLSKRVDSIEQKLRA
jgi:uncharacterized protein (DUF4415 family)